jgi:hypothetical protein
MNMPELRSLGPRADEGMNQEYVAVPLGCTTRVPLEGIAARRDRSIWQNAYDTAKNKCNLVALIKPLKLCRLLIIKRRPYLLNSSPKRQSMISSLHKRNRLYDKEALIVK